LRDDEDLTDISGRLRVVIAKIPSLSIDGEGKIQISDKDKHFCERIRATYTGNIVLSGAVTDFTSAAQQIRQLGQELAAAEGVPKVVHLTSLKQWGQDKVSKLIRDISEEIVNATVVVHQSLRDGQRTARDLLERSRALCITRVVTDLEEFSTALDVFKLRFEHRLQNILPDVRAGSKSEQELAQVLAQCAASPFAKERIRAWLLRVESEVEYFEQNGATVAGLCAKTNDGLHPVNFLGWKAGNQLVTALNNSAVNGGQVFVVLLIGQETDTSARVRAMQSYNQTGADVAVELRSTPWPSLLNTTIGELRLYIDPKVTVENLDVILVDYLSHQGPLSQMSNTMTDLERTEVAHFKAGAYWCLLRFAKDLEHSPNAEILTRDAPAVRACPKCWREKVVPVPSNALTVQCPKCHVHFCVVCLETNPEVQHDEPDSCTRARRQRPIPFTKG